MTNKELIKSEYPNVIVKQVGKRFLIWDKGSLLGRGDSEEEAWSDANKIFLLSPRSTMKKSQKTEMLKIFNSLEKLLSELTESNQRKEVFDGIDNVINEKYCKYCGYNDPHCQCWNDE